MIYIDPLAAMEAYAESERERANEAEAKLREIRKRLPHEETDDLSHADLWRVVADLHTVLDSDTPSAAPAGGYSPMTDEEAEAVNSRVEGPLGALVLDSDAVALDGCVGVEAAYREGWMDRHNSDPDWPKEMIEQNWRDSDTRAAVDATPGGTS